MTTHHRDAVEASWSCWGIMSISGSQHVTIYNYIIDQIVCCLFTRYVKAKESQSRGSYEHICKLICKLKNKRSQKCDLSTIIYPIYIIIKYIINIYVMMMLLRSCNHAILTRLESRGSEIRIWLHLLQIIISRWKLNSLCKTQFFFSFWWIFLFLCYFFSFRLSS